MASSPSERAVARRANRELSERHRAILTESKRLQAQAERLIDECKLVRAYSTWLVEECRRQRSNDFHRRLRDAIRVVHRCESKHVASFAVRKVDAGQTVWEGMVEEFRLLGHPEAGGCYAWHYLEDGRRQSFSLLKLPPADSPQRAVQLALAARELSRKLVEIEQASVLAGTQAVTAGR